MEFLWVRWYGLDTQAKSGFAMRHMYQVGFVEGEDAFRFMDPADVLHAIHLIPRFAGPQMKNLLGASIA